MSKKDPEDHLEDFFEEQRLQQADSYGRFSIFVWWAFGIYLFYMDGFLSFISWQAFVFFIIGTFAASGILGGIFF
ncbi:hypothetical protein [Thioalkalivibrio sp. ALgr3]|nr:hypothetical protein [Thioalkalivibrio sp. ALgr3]